MLKNKVIEKTEKKAKDSRVDALVKTGIQFGHKKSRWHPSMAPYVYGIRNNMYIIDIEKMEKCLIEAIKFVEDVTKQGKSIIFVATRPNIRAFLKEIAEAHKLFYVSGRWIGGTLTNFPTSRQRLNNFKELEAKKKSSEFDKLIKRDKRVIDEEIARLEKHWGGIKNLTEMPAAIFLLDVPNNYLALKEAKKKGIKVIAICDTDADIREVDYPIPASDDSFLAVKYILEKIVETISKAQEKTA